MINSTAEGSREQLDDGKQDTIQTILRGEYARLRSIAQTAQEHYLTNSTQEVKIVKASIQDATQSLDHYDIRHNFLRVTAPKETAPSSIARKVTIKRGSDVDYEEFTLADRDSLVGVNPSKMTATYTKRANGTIVEHRKESGICLDDMRVLGEWVDELDALTGDIDD